MTTLATKATIGKDGRLLLDLETGLQAGDVEVIVVVQPEADAEKDPRKLLNLPGTLSWKGDPMQFQREMRDEWPD